MVRADTESRSGSEFAACRTGFRAIEQRLARLANLAPEPHPQQRRRTVDSLYLPIASSMGRGDAMAETFEGKGNLFQGDQLVAPVGYRLCSGRDVCGHSKTHGELWVPSNHWPGVPGESLVLHTEDGFRLSLELTGDPAWQWQPFRRSLGGRLPMAWDKHSWNRYLRNTRSALVKRDALSGTGQASPGDELRQWYENPARGAPTVPSLTGRGGQHGTAASIRRFQHSPDGPDRPDG